MVKKINEMFSLIVILFYLFAKSEGRCVFPESYWRNATMEQWPYPQNEFALCGESWFTLFSHKGEGLWNRTFAQICLGSLNGYPYDLGQRVMLLLHGMESDCENKSRWEQHWSKNPGGIHSLLKEIALFNEGPQCPNTPRPTQIHERLDNLSQEEELGRMQTYLKILLFLSVATIGILLFMTKRLTRGFI